MKIRPIEASDDRELAAVIRKSLEQHGLALPGTAYFDPELDHLSGFYQAVPGREYFVVVDDAEHVLGGCGIAEYAGNTQYAELQKLYLSENAQGHGLGYRLIALVYGFAQKMKYQKLYLETHHVLRAAIHLYDKTGFHKLSEALPGSQHGSMDRFFLKDIQ